MENALLLPWTRFDVGSRVSRLTLLAPPGEWFTTMEWIFCDRWDIDFCLSNIMTMCARISELRSKLAQSAKLQKTEHDWFRIFFFDYEFSTAITLFHTWPKSRPFSASNILVLTKEDYHNRHISLTTKPIIHSRLANRVELRDWKGLHTGSKWTRVDMAETNI